MLSKFIAMSVTENPTANNKSLLRSYITGSRRASNIFWAVVVSLGGLGFFLTGLSSYLKRNLLLLSNASTISFIPQGIVLLFYGTIGLLIGLFLFLTIWWDIGFGYNEYDQKFKKIIIYRRSFPGPNRNLKLIFNFAETKSIKVRIIEGLNPKRQLFLCLQDNREIPLTAIDQPAALEKIEKEAVSLAKFLGVNLETE